MLYGILRIIIISVLFIIFIVVQKRCRKALKKNRILIYILITMVLGALLFLIPFENAFFNFSSPQAVFKYEFSGNIEAIVEGDKSTMIIYSKNNTYSSTIIPKNQNGWKLGTALTYKIIATKYYEKCMVELHQFKDSNDYYVFVMDVFVPDSTIRNITDNRHSEFNYHLSEICGVDEVTYVYYTYIKKIGDGYKLNIDGEIIELP